MINYHPSPHRTLDSTYKSSISLSSNSTTVKRRNTMPVTEIATLPLLKEIDIEGTHAKLNEEALAMVLKQKGCLGAHWGFQVEENEKGEKVLLWFINWDSLESHQAFIAKPEYRPFVQDLLVLSSGPAVQHVQFNPTPTISADFFLAAGATEWAQFKLNDNVKVEDFETKFMELIEAAMKAPGYKAHSLGWCIEDEREFQVLLGWESIKAHVDWASTEGQKFIASISAISKVSLVHVCVKGFKHPTA
ncbi:hypothetical protein RUND412_006228 [Rhizina undulata]